MLMQTCCLLVKASALLVLQSSFAVSVFRGLEVPVHHAAGHLSAHDGGDGHKPQKNRPSPAATHDMVVQPLTTRTAQQNSSKTAVLHPKPPAFLTRGSKNLKSWISSWKISCNKHIKKHPDEISCPGNCPFVRAEPSRLCQFKCVPQSLCNADNPLANFANTKTKRCESCKVAGCLLCGDERTVCAKCHEDYEIVNGLCKSKYRHAVWTVCVLLVPVGIFLIWYLFALFWIRDPTVNEEALQAAIECRENAKPRKKKHANDTELHQLALTNSLMSDTNVICGSGVVLHFRWMGAVIVWSIFTTVMYLIAYFLFWERLGLAKPHTVRSYDRCEANVSIQEKNWRGMEVVFFIIGTLVYLVTFIGSLWFAVLQRRSFRKQDQDNVTMKDFVLYTRGWPIRGGAVRLEEDRKNELQGKPQFDGLDIVGLSICWDFRHQQDEVDQKMRQEFDVHSATHSQAHAKDLAQSKDAASQNERRSCIDPELRFVDAAFGIGNFPCLTDGSLSGEPEEATKTMLEKLRSTDAAYIVFGTIADRIKADKALKDEPLIYFHEGAPYTITADATEAEPTTVMWKGFGGDHTKFILSLIVGSFSVFIGVLLLDLFLYAPYVVYIMSYSDVAGMSQGSFLSGFMLSMVIVACNQSIYALIGWVADMCAWTHSDAKDCFYCVKYTLAVFFNTCIDLGIVLILAQGYSVDVAMKMQIANDSTMSVKALAEAPDMQKSLYVQLVTYMFPGCMLIPFLLEPVFTAVVPYFLSKAMIRTRPEVTIQQAEDCMANPPFDLSRYGDVLVNMMLVCMVLVFTYREVWLLCFYMLISMVVIYAWDHLRVLRYTTKTVFATSAMDNATMYMMALPCGVLLSGLVFRAYGASHEGFLEEFRKSMTGKLNMAPDRYTIFFHCIGAFVFHVLLHWLLLVYVAWPLADGNVEAEEEQGAYKDCAAEKAANYFNTNPIHCLRSKFIYDHQPPCVYFKFGKEHLIKKNEEQRWYFEAKHDKRDSDEPDAGDTEEDLKGKATKHIRKMKSEAMAWADGV